MNKRNQIEAQRAVKQFEAKTAGGNLAVHMMLPREGLVAEGSGRVDSSSRMAVDGELLMQEEVRELVGEQNQQQPDRTSNLWGRERGYCVVMGRKFQCFACCPVL